MWTLFWCMNSELPSISSSPLSCLNNVYHIQEKKTLERENIKSHKMKLYFYSFSLLFFTLRAMFGWICMIFALCDLSSQNILHFIFLVLPCDIYTTNTTKKWSVFKIKMIISKKKKKKINKKATKIVVASSS